MILRKIIFFFPSTIFAEDVYSVALKNWWIAIFKFVDSIIWMLAILPVVVVAYSVILAKRKIAKRFDTGQGGNKSNISTMEYISIYVSHTLAALLSVFLIYGVFGIVYVDADSMSMMWNTIVTPFWREAFGISNLPIAP